MYYSKRHGRNRITVANRIMFYRLRNLVVTGIMAALIVWGASAFYRFLMENASENPLGGIKNIRITTQPAQPKTETVDIIRLKNGSVLEGSVVGETATHIIFNTSLGAGDASISLEKSKIAEIRHDVERPVAD